MPPLQLEYLREPVQIITQSAPEWQIWVGAVATLLGAMIGAGIGAWGAYVGTRRVYLESERKANLEKVYHKVFACRRKYIDVLTGIHLVKEKAGYDKNLFLKLHGLAVEARDVGHEVMGTLHVSCPEFDAYVSEFFDVGTSFNVTLNKMIHAMPCDKQEVSAYAEHAEAELESMLEVMGHISAALAKTLREFP